MNKAVLVIHGDSQFGFMDGVSAELAEGFRALGHPAVAKHLLDKDLGAAVDVAVRGTGVGMVVLMNGAGLEPALKGFQDFLESLEVPVVAYFIDHPVYQLPRIVSPLPRLIVTTSCSHDGAFIHAHIRDDVRVETLHHGATPVPDAVVRPWAERTIDVLVPSTLSCLPEVERAAWRERYGAVVTALLNATVQVYDSAPEQPLQDAIRYVLGDRGVSLSEMSLYYKVVDHYLRARAKLDSVRALLGQGVAVTVLSSGWPDDLGGPVTRLPAVPVAEGWALMGRSKIVLNHLPGYFESHERPLQAAVCGAAAASTPSAWVARVTAGQAVALPNSPQEGAAAVAAALADPALPERAARGRAAVAAGQMWRDRAGELAVYCPL